MFNNTEKGTYHRMTPSMDEPSLPISVAYDAFHEAIRRGPVVLSSPTGSGKSTQVPRWCSQTARVLVVEPRRVACRALASRIASLENSSLGQAVGYIVRDERCISSNTQIVFATPGIVLKLLASPDGIDEYETVIIDEFHERSMETDLIFALLTQRRPKRFIVMSATIDGDRLARHVGGTHVTAAGRTFPVDIQYLGYPSDLPTTYQLETRVQEAVERVLPDGDVLIFSPGKAEIRRIISALSGLPFEILPLHGGLTLQEQSRIFSKGKRRRIIVSTNVAETSLTVPSVRTVIDTGLVRSTRYQDGRGYLTLMPIAQDSAEQRAGRAGRVSSGLCIRLWGHGGRLKESTPPELHRESVVPLVLAAMACGADPETLPFPDSPPPHALATARDELTVMGAIQSHKLTETGRHLFRLPLRPELGRILVEAQGSDLLEAIVDLVAALDVDRPLFIGAPEYPEDDLRSMGCDATALIAAIRTGEPQTHALAPYTLREMRQRARRLRDAFGLPTTIPNTLPPKLSTGIGRLVLSADSRTGYIKRVRKRHIAWSNGGTEIALANTSAVNDNTRAVVVLALRSIGLDHRKGQLVAT
ncbi:MAG: helicase-related protein, partial [Myxococcota bacterium]|nr:helicase-related protein [Myxococcota bacterium]